MWPVKRRLLRDDSSYGGIATSAYVDIPTIVRETIKEIGHINAEYGFDTETCSVITAIDE